LPPEPTPTPTAEVAAATTTTVAAGPALTTDRIQVNVFDLADSVTGTVVPATPNNPNEPPQLNGAPEHVRFAFGDDQLSADVAPRERQILVYPLRDYLNLFEGDDRARWAQDFATLARLAIRQPDVVTETIPIVPAFNASQVFRSNVSYLQFPGGVGVRFITGLAQDDIPFNNDNIFYTFQGFTTDLRERISVFYPVSVENWDGAPNADEAAKFLETVPDDGFEPNLATLDAMVESLQVLTPREARAPATGLALGVDQVRLDAGVLADGITGEVVPSVANNPNEPPTLNGNPDYLRYRFGDDPAIEFSGPAQRQLLVYPVDAFRALFEGEQLERFDADQQTLINLVSERPLTLTDVLTGEIPVLPSLGAAQVLRAQTNYLDPVSGAGVRFVTFYAQDASPITNDGLFYTYQGLTSDGRYRISLFYPIEAKDIPGVASPEETTAYLDGLTSADFTPSLDELDAMVRSLRVGTYGAAASLIPPQQITTTEVLTFTPNVPELTRDGACFTNSLVSERADAWRCTSGESIYDPCFTAADGETIVCGQAPIFTEDDDGFVVNLTQPLPPAVVPSELDDIDPWMLLLQDGNLCAALSGATSGALGRQVRFGCLDGGVILGDPVRIGDIVWVDEVRADEGPQDLIITSAKASEVIAMWR
jgi:hypothetical protein